MSKNYADLYNSPNDSIALEQRFYIKQETTAGTLAGPAAADFFWTLPGGSIAFNQPFESSPHRSGRHHTSIIKKKKECTFTLKTFFNIDTTQGSASTTEVEQGIQTLMLSLFGKQDNTGGSPVFTSGAAPSITFSLFEVGDRWARQARAGFVQEGSFEFPGDGEAMTNWSGAAKDMLFVGLAKSIVTQAGGNIFHGQAGDGAEMSIGGLVMVIVADGVTRSVDTAAGTWRTITAISGDDITVDGAVFTSGSDGTSMAPVYLTYYEPVLSGSPGINNPQTGLVGSATFAGLSGSQAIRKVSMKCSNNHELVNYVYGKDALAVPFFVPGNRFTNEVSVEMNLNRNTIAFYNQVQGFNAKNLTFVLGDSASRHLTVTVPKIFFPVPAFAIPDTGSIPVTFTGNAYQTALDAADEMTLSYL